MNGINVRQVGIYTGYSPYFLADTTRKLSRLDVNTAQLDVPDYTNLVYPVFFLCS